MIEEMTLGRSFVTVLAVCALLASGCGGSVAENGQPDASSGADGSGETTADGSSEGPSVDGSSHLATGADSGSCMISASSYNQSCAVDTDCTTVTSADYCALHCLCGGSAINVEALAQFNQDISKTPLGSGALGPSACTCPFGMGPCCRSGTCTTACLGGASDGGAEASDGASGLSDSDAAQPAPDAFVSAFVGPGTGSTSVCGYQSDQSFVEIGAPLSPKPSTVTSGDFQAGAGTLILACHIDPSGGGFNIQLSAQIGGPNGGSLTAAGQVNATGGSGIQATFTSAQNGTFVDPNCSFTFTYNNQPVPVAGSPVSAGRIWGHIDCPNAVESGTSEIAADGAAVERTCDAHADLLFENCE